MKAVFFTARKRLFKNKASDKYTSFIIIIVLLITAVLVLVVPEVIKTFNVLIDLIPAFFEKVKDKATEYYNEYPEIKNIADSIYENRISISDTIMNFLKSGAGGLVGTTFGLISSVFGGIVILWSHLSSEYIFFQTRKS